MCDNETRLTRFSPFITLEPLEEKGANLRCARYSSRSGERHIAPHGKICPRDEILLDSHISWYNGGGDDHKTQREECSEWKFGRLSLRLIIQGRTNGNWTFQMRGNGKIITAESVGILGERLQRISVKVFITPSKMTIESTLSRQPSISKILYSAVPAGLRSHNDWIGAHQVRLNTFKAI